MRATIPARVLRLQRYLLAELLTAFVLVLLIMTGIVLAASMLQILQKYPELSVFAVVQSVPVFLALALPITVPVAFLMACLLSYGRFADDNEYTAFQMAGISPWHAIAPGVCAAVFLSVGTLFLNTDVNPTMTSAKKEIVRHEIREVVGRMRDPSVTNVRLGPMEISWDGHDGEWLRDAFVTWTTTEEAKDGGAKVKKTNRARANRAKVRLAEGPLLRLVVTLEGEQMPAPAGGGMTVMTADAITLVLDYEEESSLTTTKGKDELRAPELYYRMVRLEPALRRPRQAAESSWKTYRSYAGEYWRRIALGLSPLAFAVLGVPLGLVVRRGSRALALVIALLVALPVYFPLLLLGENLSRGGGMPSALALNMGNALFCVAGLVLVRRLVTR